MKRAIISILTVWILVSSMFVGLINFSDIDTVQAPYIPHSPIRINSDAEFASIAGMEGWAGNGLPGSPFIIEGYDINGSGYGYCIYIGNTTVYFEVRDSYLREASGVGSFPYYRDAGIILYNVLNGTIANNTAFTNNFYGIDLYLSSNNTIVNNNVSLNNWDGIFLYYSSSNTVSNNTVSSNNWDGVHLSSSSNNTIANNNASNNQRGIYIEYDSNNNTIVNNNASDNGGGIYVWIDSDNNTITNNTATNNLNGIFLLQSSNNTIANNIVSNIEVGISLQGSSNNNTIINNTATNNDDGISIIGSTGNIVANNSVSTNTYTGIDLSISNNNTIANNTLSNNDDGIFLYKSSNNTINNNNASDNKWGIYLSSSNNNTITNNNASNNNDGIYLYYSNENNISHNNISSCDSDGIHVDSSDGNNITDNKITNNSKGIYLSNSHNNIITNNSITDNINGIYYESSRRNNITGNTILANDLYGIRIYSSERNIITGNNVSFNGHFGFRILRSTNHTISANKMIENGINIFGEEIEQWNTHSIDNLNTINGKPVYHIKDQTGIKVPTGAGQVILSNCTNVTVEFQKCIKGSIGIVLGFSSDCNLTNNNVSSNIFYGFDLYKSFNNTIDNNIASYNQIGIYFDYSESNSVIRNNVTDNIDAGIWLYHSHYNKILSNNITRNYNGIHLEEFFGSSNYNIFVGNTILSNQNYGLYFNQALYNEVYHNNIINNTNPAYDFMGNNDWETSYPLGGNYWSDYNGVDNYKGPNQDIPGDDGIGDTSFWRDDYPLIQPYPPKPLQNYTILKQGWNLISIPFIQQNQNLTKVLEMIDGWYEAVQWYNVSDSSDPWKHHQILKPSNLNDLTDIEHTIGFWIHITNPGDTIFLYNGTQPTSNQSIPLHPGWDMVGYPSLTSRNRTAALNNLTFGTEVDAIWTFNALTQTWEEIKAGDHFEVGRGYWVHATQECVWEVPI